MIFLVSLISTVFILLILILLLEYRSRNRRALARRMRYYAGGMEDIQEKPKEVKSLKERFLSLLRGGGRLLSNIRHARGLDFKMQQAGVPLLGTEFLVLLGVSMAVAFFVALFVSKRWHVGILAAVGIAMAENLFQESVDL